MIMPIIEYNGKKPQISENAYVSPNSVLIGDIEVQDNAVIWPGSYIRAENAQISIGQYSTIFNNVALITRTQQSPINIGNFCIIETGVLIFGCFFADYIQVLAGTIIYEGASIGEGVIILENSQVPSGLTIQERAIMKGIPVEKIREQSRNDLLKVKERAEHYSQMFIKIKNQLPNIQSYVLTLSDLMKLLIDKIK